MRAGLIATSRSNYAALLSVQQSNGSANELQVLEPAVANDTPVRPNRPLDARTDRAPGVSDTRSLSELPAQSKGIFAEAELEAFSDAVVTEAGGMAAIEDLHDADTGILKKKGYGIVFWVSVIWVVGIILLAVFAKWLPLSDPKATTAAPAAIALGSRSSAITRVSSVARIACV